MGGLIGRNIKLRGATDWLNSAPLDAEGLRGKVVVVNFCTYTCINWLRSPLRPRLGHGIRGSGARRDRGAHAGVLLRARPRERAQGAQGDGGLSDRPRQRLRRVERVLEQLLAGPVLHRSRGTDPAPPVRRGRLRTSERVIQQLLREAGADGVSDELAPVDPRGPEVAADWENLESPEAYLGSRRAQTFDPSERSARGQHRSDEATRPLRRNHWTLMGNWTMTPEAAVLNEPNGRITFRFHARDIHLVMGPTAREMPVPFRVSIDGAPPGSSGATDVAEDGSGLLDEHRMYQLIRQQGAIDDRTFEIEFLDRGAQAFAFMFG